MNIKIFAALAACLASTTLYASSVVNSNKAIANLTPTLHHLKTMTSIPVMFPTVVPKNPTIKTFYAYVDTTQVTKNSYMINIDSTADCHGAHYCNLGSLKVSTDGEPQIYDDMNNKPITTTINLTPTQKASYTPGHVMGDYWPPVLEWRDHQYFYHLSWQVTAQKILVQTALSIKTANKNISNSPSAQ